MKILFREIGVIVTTIDIWNDAQFVPRVGDLFVSKGTHYGKPYVVKQVMWTSNNSVEIRLQG